MRALIVVKVEIALQRREEIESGGKVAGIDQFVLERTPQPFDENIVEGAATAIHADQDATLLERGQELAGGELRTLIGIPDFGLAEAERALERGQAEASLHSVGEFPTEHETTEPIHDGDQIQEASRHSDGGNIGAPDLIDAIDAQSTRASTDTARFVLLADSTVLPDRSPSGPSVARVGQLACD